MDVPSENVLDFTRRSCRVDFKLGAGGKAGDVVRWEQGEKHMKLTRAQKEAKLRKAAEEMIKGLLDWDEQNAAPNLTAIEDEVLVLRQRIGQAMVAVVVGGQAAQQPVENPRCPGCGREMRTKGEKRRTVESRVGGVEVERGYYYCACCKSGFFPPGPPT